MNCEFAHVFSLNDDAVCDICGIPKSKVVDIEQYRADWDARIRNEYDRKGYNPRNHYGRFVND